MVWDSHPTVAGDESMNSQSKIECVYAEIWMKGETTVTNVLLLVASVLLEPLWWVATRCVRMKVQGYAERLAERKGICVSDLIVHRRGCETILHDVNNDHICEDQSSSRGSDERRQSTC